MIWYGLRMRACNACVLSSFFWSCDLDRSIQDKVVEIHQVHRGDLPWCWKGSEFSLKTRAPGRTGGDFFVVRDKGHNQPNEFLWKPFSDFRRKFGIHCPTQAEAFIGFLGFLGFLGIIAFFPFVPFVTNCEPASISEEPRGRKRKRKRTDVPHMYWNSDCYRPAVRIAFCVGSPVVG